MINIDFTFLIQLANFLVLLFLLNQFLFKPVLAFVEKREAKLKKERDYADETGRKADKVMEDYTKAIENARTDSGAAIKDARKQAVESASGITAEAQGKMMERLNEVRGTIEKDSADAIVKLKRDVEKMAGTVASKLLGRGLN